MITALDHFGLICLDIDAGIATYRTVLGRTPDERSTTGGIATAVFRVGNTAIELMAPDGASAGADRLRDLLNDGGPRLTTLVFQSDDFDGDVRLLNRRGLSSGDPVQKVGYRTARLDDTDCAGVKTFILGHDGKPPEAQPADPGMVSTLDHLVIRTPNPDRAAAHYGARLGLHLALDRTAEQWATRFLFFRTGGLTLEVIHGLKETHDPAGQDEIWGLTWAVDDLEAAHARLAGAGLNISEVREGRKPGSRVFTVRDGTLGVPTLFIAHAAR